MLLIVIHTINLGVHFGLQYPRYLREVVLAANMRGRIAIEYCLEQLTDSKEMNLDPAL